MPRPVCHRLCPLVFVLLTWVAAVALAGPLQAGRTWLTPDVGPQIEAAFARAEPTFRLEDATIKPQRVDARVCRPNGACLDVVLTPLEANCVATVAGRWCVQFPMGPPADANVLLRALAGAVPTDHSKAQTRADVSPEQLLTFVGLFLAPLIPCALLLYLARTRLPSRWRRERLWLIFLVLALLDAAWSAHRCVHLQWPDGVPFRRLSSSASMWIWWLAPLTVGGLLGVGVRWGLGRRVTATWSAPLALLLVPFLCGWLVAPALGIGVMDGAAMALIATLTWLGLAHARFGRLMPWLVTLGSLAGSLLASEGVLRHGRPPPVVESTSLSLFSQPSPRPDGLRVGAGELLVHCALFAEIGDETARCLRLQSPPADMPWILHLGDSMVFGPGVPEGEALPGQFTKLLPGFAHLNGGVPGTSVDTELALLIRVLAVSRPSLVVLYAMPGNDADDVEMPIESCDGQSPLELNGETARLRCPQPKWTPQPWYAALVRSRLPLPVAALMDVSWVARQLTWLQFSVVEPLRAHPPPLAITTAKYGRYLHAMRALLQASDIPLQIVVMPMRRSQYGAVVDSRRAQLAAVLHESGAAVIDTQPVVDTWVAQEGEGAVFLDDARGDIHLNPKGLAKVAEFLAPQLALPQPPTPSQ